MKYKTLDCVVLERDLPDYELRRGDLGTIVLVHEPDGLEVEFVTPLGMTAALVTLKVTDVRPVVGEDRISVRTQRSRI